MLISSLPNWDNLKPAEKKRIKDIFKERIKDNYNIDGSLSVSSKELKKGERNIE